MFNISMPTMSKMDVAHRRIYEVFKKDVRTREKPEGSMSEGYLMQEAMGFCT